jgi:hypothetical protein
MAGGDNHAKQIVMDEAARLADKLQNGNAGCMETQGRAIGLLVKMITPLYTAEFVTAQECRESRAKIKSVKGISRIKIGPVEIEGQVTKALLAHSIPLICCGLVIFMAGKLQNWW